MNYLNVFTIYDNMTKSRVKNITACMDTILWNCDVLSIVIGLEFHTKQSWPIRGSVPLQEKLQIHMILLPWFMLMAESLYVYNFRHFDHYCMCTRGIKVSKMVNGWAFSLLHKNVLLASKPSLALLKFLHYLQTPCPCVELSINLWCPHPLGGNAFRCVAHVFTLHSYNVAMFVQCYKVGASL